MHHRVWMKGGKLLKVTKRENSFLIYLKNNQYFKKYIFDNESNLRWHFWQDSENVSKFGSWMFVIIPNFECQQPRMYCKENTHLGQKWWRMIFDYILHLEVMRTPSAEFVVFTLERCYFYTFIDIVVARMVGNEIIAGFLHIATTSQTWQRKRKSTEGH